MAIGNGELMQECFPKHVHIRTARRNKIRKHEKGKDFYDNGSQPPSGESTTTECGVNYQLLAVILPK